MRFRPLALVLVGTGILVTTSTIASAFSLYPGQAKQPSIAAQPPTSSHTIQGKLTSTRADTASAPCNQISVKAEIWNIPEELDLPTRKRTLGSTEAQGSTLGKGCSYTLKFDYSPTSRLGELSYYRLVAETPVINGSSAAHYRSIPGGQYPKQYNLKF